jgi:asparagine synthase (glutamine-hydrolysing)
MSYRGPGIAKIRSVGDFAIGHVRLPIQDLTEAAAQPYERLNGGLLAFVGEIFTKDQGKSELETLDRVLRQGKTQLQDIDGFWSIIEVSESGAYATTDYLGTKPLYYWESAEIVCSEIEPMFQLRPRPDLDEVYLSNCIKFGYDYSGRTPYLGIRQLPPGVSLDMSSGYQYSYWDWSRIPGSPLNLMKTLRKSVENRLISDVPVGLLLSGGLDSSIIYHLVKSLGVKPLVFSVENGESEYLPAGVKPIFPEDVSLEEAVGVMQAPLDLGSLVPQIQLARALNKQGLKVAITGDGADELFGGYTRSRTYDSQASDIFCELPYYHLPRLDRVMMRSTIEQRSPFLAPQVIATALRTPRELRTDKEILKRAFRGMVDDRIIDRPKHPLKTQAVIQGGLEYRSKLVEEFRHHVRQSFSI